MLSFSYFKLKESKDVRAEEFYILFSTALLGAGVIVSSTHFISFFLGLEILSVSLYPLIAYFRNSLSVEAGIKYLILAAASSAFLLFGFGLVYLETGTMEFALLAGQIKNVSPLASLGLGLILAAVAFKLAVVPFHLWTADIYQGAPPQVTALVATVSKGSMIAFFMRFTYMIDGLQWDWIVLLLTIFALASMLFGNILALLQSNIKRLLAFSSIAHIGYVLVAVLVKTPLGMHAATFYLTAYFVTIIIAFGVVSQVTNKDQGLQVKDLQSMFWNEPLTALLLSLSLLSLAGIPLTAGFMGKYYLLTAGISQEFWLLVVVLVISSVIGLFYYLRVIMKMLETGKSKGFRATPVYTILGVLAAILLVIGVYPSGLISWIETLKLF